LGQARVRLAGGTSVTATRAYLRRSITRPDAQVVAGYPRGLMRRALRARGITVTVRDAAALAEFIETIGPS
jgi:hypothetical protein